LGREGLGVTAPTLGEVHRRELERFRGAMNLIGPGPVDEHFDDARAALAELRPEGRWVDLGTGAGFPGLVLAELAPALDLELVDSRRKRCWFVEHVLASSPPRPGPIVVRCARAESLPAAAYDGVISRAFAPPAEVVAHARRLLRPGGALVLLLQDDAEIDVPPDFSREAVTRYRVAGRGRRSERWRLRG
jgi:16S rRNA G527 N7-methylase RsmG